MDLFRAPSMGELVHDNFDYLCIGPNEPGNASLVHFNRGDQTGHRNLLSLAATLPAEPDSNRKAVYHYLKTFLPGSNGALRVAGSQMSNVGMSHERCHM